MRRTIMISEQTAQGVRVSYYEGEDKVAEAWAPGPEEGYWMGEGFFTSRPGSKYLPPDNLRDEDEPTAALEALPKPFIGGQRVELGDA